MTVTLNLSGEGNVRLKTWIEELLPENHDTSSGAQPLNLEELQNSLGASGERDAKKRGGSRAA
jgi:hypothetical protein